MQWNNERHIAYQIDVENGFDRNTVNTIEYKVITKKWVTFTFINNNMKKITNFFKNMDIKKLYRKQTITI